MITQFLLPKLDDIDSANMWFQQDGDLTPLDFFLCGFLKSKVYVNKPATTRELQEEIERCINEI